MRPVEIVDYDPSWPARFAAERDKLLALFGNLVDDIHHIGSTAVPGLAAKPNSRRQGVHHPPAQPPAR